MRRPVRTGSTHQYLFARVYNAIVLSIVLRSGAPCFLAELLGAKSTSHAVILIKHWQALLSHKKCTRDHLRKSKIPKLSGGTCPHTPLAGAIRARGSQINLSRMASAVPVLKLPSLATRLSILVRGFWVTFFKRVI